MAHDTLRNYSHCPPKKRPLAFYSAQADDHGECAAERRSCSRKVRDASCCVRLLVMDYLRCVAVNKFSSRVVAACLVRIRRSAQ